MKGRMDVLNFNKHRSLKPSTHKEVIRIETDDEQEKENCEDLSQSSDLGNESINKMEVDFKPMKDDISDDEMAEDDVIPELPVLSVIIKEEDDVLQYNDGLRPEIKYEDDIEEEEYDSEDSLPGPIREMPPLIDRNHEKHTQRISHTTRKSQSDNFENVRVSSNNFNPSMLNFARDSSSEEKTFSNDSKELDQLESAGNGDSVLLSIVYATINVPFSQVSKFLTAYNLSKSQLSIIRKVRRQVKNRLYAQNCRRRRVAHIKNLANELKQIKTEKEKLYSVRHELKAEKESIERRYNELFTYVMHIVRERCKNERFQFLSDLDDEELKDQHTHLADERAELEERTVQLNKKYENLYKYIFKVISDRNSNFRLTKKGADNPFNLQLCNMDIVNELAILNKYYSKNNNSMNEVGDFESSISMDDSQASESKMNDFVDYESCISMDGSRTEENTLEDLEGYESNMNGNTYNQSNGRCEESEKKVLSSAPLENTREINDIRLDDECESRISESSAKAWPENSENEDGDEDDVVDDDESDEELLYVAQLEKIKKDLETNKASITQQYQKLYDHVLQTAKMSEADFLKAFMDHCIMLLKVPGRDLCSIAFDES